MTENIDSKVKQSLQCPSCNQVLDDPRKLRCGHSLCGPPRQCLATFFQNDNRCPACYDIPRFKATNPDEFPKNYVLMAILEEVQGAVIQQLDHYLELCEEHGIECEFYCRSCDVMICKTCWQSDHSNPEHKHSIGLFDASKQKLDMTEVDEKPLVDAEKLVSKASEIAEVVKNLRKVVEDFQLQQTTTEKSAAECNEERKKQMGNLMKISSKVNELSNDLEFSLKDLSVQMNRVGNEVSEMYIDTIYDKSSHAKVFSTAVPLGKLTLPKTQVKKVVVNTVNTIFLQTLEDEKEQIVLRKIESLEKYQGLSVSPMQYRSSQELWDIAVANDVLYSLTIQKADNKRSLAVQKDVAKTRGFYILAHNTESMEAERLVVTEKRLSENGCWPNIAGNSQYLVLYMHDSKQLTIFSDEKCLATVSLMMADVELMIKPSTLRSDCDYLYFEHGLYPPGFSLVLSWKQLNPFSRSFNQNIDVTIQSLQSPKPRIMTLCLNETTKLGITRHKIGIDLNVENCCKLLIHRNLGTLSKPSWSLTQEEIVEKIQIKDGVCCPVVPFIEESVLVAVNSMDKDIHSFTLELVVISP